MSFKHDLLVVGLGEFKNGNKKGKSIVIHSGQGYNQVNSGKNEVFLEWTKNPKNNVLIYEDFKLEL